MLTFVLADKNSYHQVVNLSELFVYLPSNDAPIKTDQESAKCFLASPFSVEANSLLLLTYLDSNSPVRRLHKPEPPV